ncbi:hypothetical protein G9A89_020329 [Geosiphon pyriformis]|nr:hypothetical protein G9A89_020329 [Geosiphon pyriformis]
MSVFIVIEPVGSSVGSSGSGLTGLGTHPNIKKKHVESIVLYKKPKKPDAGSVLINLSIGFLVLEDIRVSGNKSIISWRSKIGSVINSISGFLDVENMTNTVVKKTSYTKSDENNNINNAMPKKTCTQTYMLGNFLKASTFDSMNDDKNVLSLPSPKFNSSN